MARLSDLRQPRVIDGDFSVGGNLSVGDPFIRLSRVFERSARPTSAETEDAGWRIGDIWVYRAAEWTEVYRAGDADGTILSWELVSDLPLHITTTNPTAAASPILAGFPRGRRWLNSTTQTLWVRTAEANQDDDWREEGAVVDGLTLTGDLVVGGDISLRGRNITPIYTMDREPVATDDVNSGFAVGDWWFDSVNNFTYRAVSVAVGQADWSRSIANTQVVQLWRSTATNGSQRDGGIDLERDFVADNVRLLVFRGNTIPSTNFATNTGVISVEDFVGGAVVVLGDLQHNSEASLRIRHITGLQVGVARIASGTRTEEMSLYSIYGIY